MPELERLHAQAEATGLHDLEVYDAKKLKEVEPALDCISALYSPSTGIIDSHAYMLALQGHLEAHGGQVVLNSSVDRIEQSAAGYAHARGDERRRRHHAPHLPGARRLSRTRGPRSG